MMAELLSDVSEYLYDDAPKNLEAKVPHVGMRLGLPKRMSVLTNWLTRLNLTGYDVADEGEIVHQTGGRKIVTAGKEGKTLPTVSGRVGTRPHPQRTVACGSTNTKETLHRNKQYESEAHLLL